MRKMKPLKVMLATVSTGLLLQGCSAILELAAETVEFAVETTAEAVETVGELTLMAVGVASSAGKSAMQSPYNDKDDVLDEYYR